MPRTILLADDSVTIQKVVELTFMDEDYEVEAVGDGTAAIARLDSRCPDLLIADVHMPGADGYEVCRQAKARYPDLPVLLLVGTFEPFNAAAAREAGADDHLKKPFDAQDLQKQVEDLIAASSAKTAYAPAPVEVAPVEVAPVEVAPVAVAEEPPAVLPAESEVVEDAAELAVPEPVTDSQINPDFAAMPSFSFDDAPTEAISSSSLSEATPPSTNESPFATALHKTAFPDPAPEFKPEAPAAAFQTVHMESPPRVPVEDTIVSSASEDSLPTEELELQQPLVSPEPLAPEPLAPEPLAPEVAIEADRILDTLVSTEEPVAPVETVELVETVEPVVEVAPATVVEASRNGGPLSDDDVDRIARRVAELIGEGVVREVAWEVVPDLAEVVIKERLRELEDQVG